MVIVGESGVGKSLIARSIHAQSTRRDRPFLELACDGIDEVSLELDLFGQKVDGFDPYDQPGRLLRAHQGTLLLDEVASLSAGMQARLLRVLIDGEYEPVGSDVAISVDVRFLFATRENLAAMVEQGSFRRDLFERISDVSLKIPPLRHRGRDAVRLAERFRDRFATELAKPIDGFTPDALDLIARHDWPGNVRELEGVVRRAASSCPGSWINPVHLSLALTPLPMSRSARPLTLTPRPATPSQPNLRPLKEALEEPEKQIIIEALRALNWNRQETARVLDINRTTLYKKMKKYGLLMDEPVLAN